MPADYLSRYVVSAISLSNQELEELQGLDKRIQLIKRFLISQELRQNLIRQKSQRLNKKERASV